MSEYSAGIDPAIVEMVEQVRDRFGVRGLRSTAWLIAGEIERTTLETDHVFTDTD